MPDTLHPAADAAHSDTAFADGTPPPQRPLVGAGWMLVTGLLFVGVTGIVKHVGQAVPAPQAAFLRFSIGLLLILPALRPVWRLKPSPALWRLFALRAAVHTAAVTLWFYAMARLPVAEVTAMNYLTPALVSVGAIWLLGEAFAPRRLIALAAALGGVALILRPGLRAVESGHLAMLLAALCFSGSYLVAKRLTGQVPAAVVVGTMSIGVTIGLAPLAAAVWVVPTPAELGWLAAVAALATAGHWTMTLAFASAPVSATQPVAFLQLVWASLLGLAAFGEAVDPFVVTGGALIFAAVLWSVLGERGGPRLTRVFNLR